MTKINQSSIFRESKSSNTQEREKNIYGIWDPTQIKSL